MFTTLIVQPIFNLLVFIYALIPGHNFGLAIIVFTIIIRLLMWPLVKKQLYHTRAMRELQPEMKRIKKAAAGDKQKESRMIMELYKEREVNPFSSIGLLLVQLPIFIGLFSGINRIINDKSSVVEFAYPFIQNLGWMRELSQDITLFDNTLFGVVDLGQAAISGQGFYLPAFLIVLASAIAQYFQGKQIMPKDKDAKSLKAILKEAGTGKQADQSDINAAVGRFTIFLIPGLVFVFTIGFPAALPLYWLTTSLVAVIQQATILKKDEEGLQKAANKSTASKITIKDTSKIPEAKTVTKKDTPKKTKQKSKNVKKRKKRSK